MRIAHRWRSAALAAVLLTATAVGPAAAHEGNPDYRSEVRTVTPPTDGVTVRVLDHDDSLELTNRSDQPVLVYGSENEPYVRLLADGSVQVNEASATIKAAGEEEHEDDDHASAGYVLASYDYAHGGETHEEEGHDDHSKETSGKATSIRWVTLDKTGRFAWHEDRIKYRKTAVPPQVTDTSKETKVLDWRVPIRVGTQAGAIEGTLFWVGEPGSSGGFPVAAVISLVVVALLAAATVVIVRRRRGAADGSSGTPTA